MLITRHLCISIFFSCCYKKTAKRKQVEKERVCFGLQFEDTVHYNRTPWQQKPVTLHLQSESKDINVGASEANWCKPGELVLACTFVFNLGPQPIDAAARPTQSRPFLLS